MLPLILLFGFYVLFHGESGPGGGFQAGAILGAGLLLSRLTFGIRIGSARAFSSHTLLILAGLGVLLFAGTGIYALFLGQEYLDYSALPSWLNSIISTEHSSRIGGIFLIEIGVAIGVFAVLSLIYDHLVESNADAD
jgi:multicomponent Na+:H+ antiporter subunit B